jgi:dolichol-phosphate mannosyltransferase
MAADLDHAQGDACVIMDADMQDPPSLIPEMVRLWRTGAEVVYAVRRSREGETLFKRLTARLFYRIIRRLSGVNIPVDTGDFRLMDRVVVDALCRLPERTRFLRGLVAWAGFRQVGLPFDRPRRTLGETKFPLKRMVRFAVDGITSFSHVPLRAVTFLGLGSASLSLVLTAWALFVRLATDRSVPGWTSQIIAALFLGGVQMLALGIIGEYIARIFDESKHRPLYLVRRFIVAYEERD